LRIDPKHTLQRHNTENSKQIFPEKELRGHRPNFHIFVSVSDLYISPIGLLILLQENMLHMNEAIGTEGRAIPFLRIHKWDFVAVDIP
jgi:hypothetical protein